MADEQTPQSDLIDDAIRQAERQLEEKLQALRLSALGEAPAPAAASDDVAVLRPTGAASTRVSEPGRAEAPEQGESPETADPRQPSPVAWQETGGDDVTFAPVGDTPGAPSTGLYVPDEEHPFEDFDGEPPSMGEVQWPVQDGWQDQDEDEDEEQEQEQEPRREEALTSSMRDSLSTTVTDLTPVWDDEDDSADEPQSPQPTTRRASEPQDHPEPVHATWTDPSRSRREPASLAGLASLPSEDELQFWAQTRTALRNLQQVTDGLSTQVVGGVSAEMARMLHEQLAPTDQTLRAMHERLEAELPRLGERVEDAIQQAMTGPNNAIRQVRDEIPTQLDRSARAAHDAVREELERTAASVHGAVQYDITQLEQSIATNVTRMAQGTTDQVGRVERDIDVLGETVVRFERGVHAEFDRIDSQLRTSIERVEQELRDELVEPTELVRKLDQELPARFNRVERSLHEQLQGSQRELANVLTSLVDADRAALDRLASLASTMDEDRARRAEDLDVVVDTVTTGWEGLAGAMAVLFEQIEEQSRRMAGIEQRLLQLRDVEGALQTTLDGFQRHIRDLKPSPIVVTVSHDEAEVRNATRGGWVDSAR